MFDLTSTEWSILDFLCDEPWLTPHQLALWFHRSKTRIHADLENLLARSLIQRLNPRSEVLANRAVYAVCDRGVHALAEHAGVEATIFRKQHQISRSRYVQLLWLIERVVRVRNLTLHLEQGEEEVNCVALETEERFVYRSKEHILQLHGRGILFDALGRLIPFVVEWETGEMTTSVRKLTDFVLWQLTPRFLSREGERCFPHLLVIVPRFDRISEIIRLMRRSALQHGLLPMPSLFLTTATLLAKCGMHAPVWFSTENGKWGRVFEAVPFLDNTFRVFSPVSTPHCRHSGKIGTFRTKPFEGGQTLAYADLLQFKLQLSPQAKRMLREVAVHPLLTARELAFMMDADEDRVRRELNQLLQWKLIRATIKGAGHYYLLAILGLRYLTADAGYGRAVRQYARQKGLRGGTRRLLFHFQHTRATNEFFLRWMQLARAQDAGFQWQSELESQRYFREHYTPHRHERIRLHRFLPDGSGIWRANGKPFRFVVEIDRTRESRENLVNKFKEYYAWVKWRAREWEDESIVHVLVVTSSWERSETIREAVIQARPFGEGTLSLWVTTIKAVEGQGINGSIWRHILDWRHLKCFPCCRASAPSNVNEVVE